MLTCSPQQFNSTESELSFRSSAVNSGSTISLALVSLLMPAPLLSWGDYVNLPGHLQRGFSLLQDSEEVGSKLEKAMPAGLSPSIEDERRRRRDL